jgi:hypothetical protein
VVVVIVTLVVRWGWGGGGGYNGGRLVHWGGVAVGAVTVVGW